MLDKAYNMLLDKISRRYMLNRKIHDSYAALSETLSLSLSLVQKTNTLHCQEGKDNSAREKGQKLPEINEGQQMEARSERSEHRRR